MNSVFLRWGVPALVTVAGGTFLAISGTSAGIATDLGGRAVSALTETDRTWAAVDFDARDAVLRGTATTQQMIDEAIARLAAVHGVRSVRSEVVLAEFVSPFPFAAVKDEGGVTLDGGVPDETSHREIVALTDAATDGLRLMSGAPPVAQWRAAVDLGLSFLAGMDQGSVTLADLDLEVSGRASSPAAYDALIQLRDALPPAGIRLAAPQITPALVSPFTFRADFDGQGLTVSGFTPDGLFADTLRAEGVKGHRVATSLVLASGAPENFTDTAQALLENLVLLEEGSVEISDTTSTLAGAPPDRATAEAVQLAITELGAGAALAPPRIDGYEFIAERTGALITLSGYVPDSATRDRLDALAGVDASGLELARGQPERFDSAVEYGLDLLGRLSEGRFVISNTTLTISGRAATSADFAAAETTLSLGAPQGLILAGAQIRPPIAAPYIWSATKHADGTISMDGYVPSRETGNELRAAVADLGEDRTTIADGDPEGFAASAAAALALLPSLDTARVDYDGARWSLRGGVSLPQTALDVERAFDAAGLRAAGWSLTLDLPEAAAPAALPIIDPYVWRAQKAASGQITLGGFVPTHALRQVLLERAGAGAIDTTSLGAGFPDEFVRNTLGGMDALLLLREGALGFDGRTWSLTGQVETGARRLEAEAALELAVDIAGWQVAIQALDAAPVASPYRWQATRSVDGAIALSGYVSSAQMQQFVAVRAGTVSEDSTEIASGEPAGFAADVLAALEALSHLQSGTARFEDGAWTLTGTPATAENADLAIAALAAAASGGPGWSHRLDPPMTPPEPPPASLVEAPAEAVPAPEPEAPVEEPAAATPEELATDSEPEAAAPEATETPAVPAVEETPPQAAEPASVAATPPRDFVFSATKPLGGAIEFAGQVPADATRRYFSVVANGAPTDSLALSDTLPDDFVATGDAGIRLLATLDSGRFGFDGTTWALEGRVVSEAARAAALGAIAALPSAAGWQTDIGLLPALDICREKVGAFAARNAILFESGSARLAVESAAPIDELAAYLDACPEATVHVEGHTDSDGGDELNLALSVARAEAVVEALVERGVRPQRLYAVGYGASLPVADNATAAGKRANRRIAFTILDEHQ